ncbi:MAG: asparagine synthase (glutamine-hydrolyzing) [Moraxellaceae bacterium]|nr:MAG: asparagine synthase (glutamine-hydrolyzing) [Moraxellaceae bacterium]
MCGIAGFWNLDKKPADTAAVEAMLDQIIHRGPDDRGIWSNKSVGLGHQRLSILDLSDRGHQPFITADKQGIIVYNGEVYNYPELRSQLEQEGVIFTSTTDTEVVLYALHQWGAEKAIPLFNGMFSFAYLDQRKNQLVLARDRLGIKPLYVAKTNQTLVFGSEIKALLAHPNVPCMPDRHALTLHAILYRLEGEMTPFEGIESLRPGSYWIITDDNISKVDYFDVLRDLDVERIIRFNGQDPQHLIAKFASIFSDSVRIHMASDAPLATMCSGGVDSSLITAVAKDFRSDLVAYVADVKTAVSEGDIAKRVGRHLDVPIHQVDVDLEALLRLWPEAAWYGDQPNTHPNDMAMLAVSRACQRDGIKVVLTGEGSDELFGGYSWQADVLHKWRGWRNHPFAHLNMNNKWIRRISTLMPSRFHLNPPDMDDPFSRYLGRKDDVGGLRLLFPLDPNRQLRGKEFMQRLEGVGSLEERAFLARGLDDMHGHLESLLKRNDRMGMAASIETRTPFIENRIIDMGMHASFNAKYHDGQGKWIVKKISEKRLPHDIIYQPKLGFPTSLDFVKYALPLLKGGMVPDLFRWSSRQTLSMTEFLQQDPVTMWNIMSIEIWARLFLRGESTEHLGEQLVQNLYS